MFKIDKAVLVVIDVQGKLAEIVHQKEQTYSSLQKLIKACQILQIPIIHTEQLPEKIGSTIEPFASLLKGSQYFLKSTFSCCGADDFLKFLRNQKRSQVIVAGI
ncbi:MAG: isochorismatase family protein, partial [Candidatus Omnitrophica bacterium]|nr:isochorismatase family protein [Candidatus Omnitrophota bacterium]